MIELSYPALDKNPLVYPQDGVNEKWASTLRYGTVIAEIQGHKLYQYKSPDLVNFAMQNKSNTKEIPFFMYGYLKSLNGHVVFEERLVWKQEGFLPNYVASLVVEFILPSVKSIVCSNEHTNRGRKLWFKICELARSRGYSVYYLSWKENSIVIEKIKDLDKIPDLWEFKDESSRFLISKVIKP